MIRLCHEVWSMCCERVTFVCVWSYSEFPITWWINTTAIFYIGLLMIVLVNVFYYIDGTKYCDCLLLIIVCRSAMWYVSDRSQHKKVHWFIVVFVSCKTTHAFNRISECSIVYYLRHMESIYKKKYNTYIKLCIKLFASYSPNCCQWLCSGATILLFLPQTVCLNIYIVINIYDQLLTSNDYVH